MVRVSDSRASVGGEIRAIMAELDPDVALSIGLVVAYGFSRVLAAALFGLMELDPILFVGVAATLGCAVVVASWVPAVRATRVDPVEALRSE
jgi:ABC-type antimicrobial peptide transport system permease subunit